ncbi:ATP-dependent DNA helicase PIF6-like [Cynara cardunculus var. scolymus]|uniref:ATP-dependent DNA helicase PIF6-like n=1 Tax=Cynara cardunculus var. scolymus TaxID=59895 RepID=UPI000D62CAA0|nr:ATP-dependent DNA helicase PIF6-like [Cynara cardunculus var. scolymus]
MRLTANSECSEIEQTRVFANWILDLGEGKVGGDNDGDEKEYLSSYMLCESEQLHDQFDTTLYSPDVLNGLKLSGIPNHKILLKVGVPIILLRNIDQKSGLSNGTRLQVLSLGNQVIEAQIISGSNIGSRTFIPRMSLTLTDKRIPFKFRMRQFPVVVCFVMTINKSQGQSLSKVRLFLRQPVFTHGQLYVALPRVKSKQDMKVLIIDDNRIIGNGTKNVVYKEVFSNL